MILSSLRVYVYTTIIKWYHVKLHIEEKENSVIFCMKVLSLLTKF